MYIQTWSFRNADIILNMKTGRRRELETALIDLQGSHPIDGLHRKVQERLTNFGWSKKEEISSCLPKNQCFDNFVDRIAVEIEFSRYENIYRDYLRFLLSYSEDKIDVGVLIVFTDNTRMLYKDPNVAPYYEMCINELPKMKSVISVPIFVIGFHSGLSEELVDTEETNNEQLHLE